MNIIICYNEENILKEIEQECRTVMDKQDCISCFLSLEELKEYLLQRHSVINLFILGVENIEDDWIEMRKLISRVYDKTNIIFLADSDEMMEKAFGRNVIGFLKREAFKERLCMMIKEIQIELEQNAVIRVTEGKKMHELYIKKIAAIQAQRVYTKVCLAEKHNREKADLSRSVYRISLNQWEQYLAEYPFFRVNRSCIINLSYVDKIADKVIMKNGECHSISDRKRIALKKIYKGYCTDTD